MSTKAFEAFATMGLGTQAGKVEQIKQKAAELFDAIDSVSIEPNATGGRHIAVAKTKLEEVVMWAVKGVSRAQAEA